MKKSIDGYTISDRVWYYLLDFNDRDNWKTIEDVGTTRKLHYLTAEQIKKLFVKAFIQDFKNIPII
jgi:hypothetical protein